MVVIYKEGRKGEVLSKGIYNSAFIYMDRECGVRKEGKGKLLG